MDRISARQLGSSDSPRLMRDYKVVFPSDANATFDEAMHQATLVNIDLLFGRVMTTDELLSEIGVRTAAAD